MPRAVRARADPEPGPEPGIGTRNVPREAGIRTVVYLPALHGLLTYLPSCVCIAVNKWIPYLGVRCPARQAKRSNRAVYPSGTCSDKRWCVWRSRYYPDRPASRARWIVCLSGVPWYGCTARPRIRRQANSQAGRHPRSTGRRRRQAEEAGTVDRQVEEPEPAGTGAVCRWIRGKGFGQV